ncbi:MAG: type I restriction-modification system subunit M, partial [Clostridia bacterium]|nr:type I restriction-modification system subunit M [Clostridia bacterium]
MNKQQLSAKIWESANKMRSKIEANEYKDYILGFIFYKFLSEKEVEYLKKNDWTDEYLPELTEEDKETVTSVQKNIGYFISYENLFSTWLEMGKDFRIEHVHDALSAFNRNINSTHKRVFEKIFDTLQTGLSKLGDNSASQSKAIRDLVYLIKDIPMDGKQDYDVLGFIYEDLIRNFASNAGKKAGEFYTPHEVSLLMSDIVAHHLQNRKEIKIYDPTSGSGSLLITIGKSTARYMKNRNNIKYYAQELKQNTYNLTRMNLVMRGILPDNIVTRCGDTLEEDWPYFDENDPAQTYDPLYVDAVVSNPPYSQSWDPTGKENDVRFARFGLAPKGKADYAFLLHDLFHVKDDGIMTIVLPHGVLFRGGEEGEIRRNLIEQNHIDAIIGLPANIFYGTGIPTIIMVLKQKRENNDVLIIDASKGFIKEGKNNRLRACDIKRIVDTVTDRRDVPKFAKKVSREEIRRNDYNLNIPRYVDSSEETESWDIYASMFGGIPEKELDSLQKYWSAFPHLREELFREVSPGYCEVKDSDIKSAVQEHEDVQLFRKQFCDAFRTLEDALHRTLVEEAETVNAVTAESDFTDDIFTRLKDIPLVDFYEAYQLLHDSWETVIENDLEMIQTEGPAATTQVDPNLVLKKKNGKDQEVQDGWKGHILPFELVQ